MALRVKGILNVGVTQLDITLLDQMILTGDERYYSFAEEGDL